MHPQCRYGQTWYQLSTYDPKRGWSSRRDLLGGSVARNFAYLESTCARGRGSISHENMGRNLRFWTLEICLPYHESPPRTLGTPDATLATFWKRTFGTSTNELDDQIWTIFSSEALAWLEGGGCRCWPVDDGGGQFYQILYTVVEFVSQVVYIFILFVLVRALKWAAFSACEPQTQTQTQRRIYSSCFVLQYPTVCVHRFRTLFHVVSEIQVLHHTSTSGQYAS